MWFAILFVLIWIVLATAAFAGVSAAPWVPTRKRERNAFLNTISLERAETIYDLGAGTGTVLFDIANRHPNVKLIGYEISILPWAYSLIKKYLFYRKYKNVSLRFGNVFTKDYSDADVIFVFLLDKSYKKLIPVLKTTKPETLIAVAGWPLKYIPPRDVIDAEATLPIHLYEGSQFAEL